VQLVGVVVLSAGCGLLSVAAGMIVGGLGLLAFGIAAELAPTREAETMNERLDGS
jgi:hypothetical protein